MSDTEYTAEETATEETATETVADYGIDHTVMYIGPNRFDKGLKFNTIYRDGVSSTLMEPWVNEFKNIKRLFVAIDDIDKAISAVEKTGTPLNIAYKEVMKGE